MHWRFGEWRVKLIEQYGLEFSERLDMFLARRLADGFEYLQPDGSFVEVKQTEMIERDKVKPVATIPMDAFQSLMDQLWARGIRPQERRYEEETALLREVLETQGKHLEDMRTIAMEDKETQNDG